MRQPLSWQRGGAAALIALVLVAGAALVLDADAGAELAPVWEYLEERGTEPVSLVTDAGAAARIVLLADVHGQPGPKRLAARAIRELAQGPGLDAVVLEVPSDEQPYIEAYMTRVEEDATVLLSRPALVREHDGTPRDYLQIYSTIWRLNRELGAARQIRVIAADLPGWPPPEGAPPERVAELYAARTEHMLRQLDQQLLALTPDARVLVFMDGYLTLQRTHGQLRFAGGEPVRVEWLGELLRQRSGPDARTILVDAPATTGTVQRLPEYRGTELYRPLRRELDGDAAVRVDDTFSVVREPVIPLSAPGLRMEILPAGYVLRDVASGYVFLESGR